MKFSFVLLFLVTFCPGKLKSAKLPNDFYTLFYSMGVEPNLHDSTYRGQNVIYALALAEKDSIIIHGSSKLLDFKVNYVFQADTLDVFWKILNTKFDNQTQTFEINLDRPIPIGTTVRIGMDFHGVFGEEGVGFYKGSYLNENGDQKYFAVTQLDPIYAKLAFPNFDEPSRRALVQIGIVRESNQISLGNANLFGILPHSMGSLDVYEPTPYMPAHRIAYAVGEFDSVTSEDGFYGVYGRPKIITDGKGLYALEMAQVLLPAMVTYPTFIYPLKKLHILALPDDYFAPDAKSNWGLIIAKEKHILYSEMTNTEEDKENVLRTLSRTIASQWFGNLISPMWWDNAWLSEGFSKYFEIYLSNLAEPSWRIWEHFHGLVSQEALAKDGTSSSRPMTSPVDSFEEIEKVFDFVSSEKAASVLRMMENMITGPVFKTGIQNYFTNISFYAANEELLWNCFQDAVNLHLVSLPDSVSNIMSTWTKQAGYPLVSVNKNEDGTITLKQERFYYNPSLTSSEIWNIPISLTSSQDPDFSDPRPSLWLSETEIQIPGLILGPDDWFIINIQGNGHFRSNYDTSLRQNILNLMTSDQMPIVDPITRAQILDDVLFLCKTGRLSYQFGLNYLSYMLKEDDYIPWFTYYRDLEILEVAIRSLDAHSLFVEYLREAIALQYNKLGLQEGISDSHQDKIQRSLNTRWACYLGIGDCLVSSIDLALNGEILSPNEQNGIWCGALRSGSEEVFALLMSLYENSETDVAVRRRIIKSLACSNRIEHLQNLLVWVGKSKDEEKLAYSTLYKETQIGFELSLDYLISNLEDMMVRFSQEELGNLIKDLSQKSFDETSLNKFDDFLQVTPHPGLEDAFIFARNQLQENRDWKLRSEADITEFLTNRYI